MYHDLLEPLSKVMLEPLNPRVIKAPYGDQQMRAMGDYAGNGGIDLTGYIWGMLGNGKDGVIVRRPDGTSQRSGGIKAASITDGQANTLLVGEHSFNTAFPLITKTDDDAGWIEGWDWDTIRWGRYQPCQDYLDNSNDAKNDYYQDLTHSIIEKVGAFGSAHAGSFSAVFCDGSVRKINYGVQLQVFSAASTRNGGEAAVLD